MTGFVVNGVILIVSGLLGLLLLWPDTELVRLCGTTLQPKLAELGPLCVSRDQRSRSFRSIPWMPFSPLTDCVTRKSTASEQSM
jgi:hypothetical protein